MDKKIRCSILLRGAERVMSIIADEYKIDEIDHYHKFYIDGYLISLIPVEQVENIVFSKC